MRVWSFVVAMAAAMSGCGVTEPVETPVLSQFDSNDVSVPDTVDVGVPFTVTVRTWLSTCEAKGDTVVEMISESSMEALVVPYTLRVGKPEGSSGPCLGAEGVEHVATLQFNLSGIGTVFIRVNEGAMNRDLVYEVVVR